MNKSQKGSKGSVGAPRKEIVGLTTKPIRGLITIAKLVELNTPNVCELTIRKTVEAHVEGVYRNTNGKVTGKATPRLIMLKQTIKQDGVGRPEFAYRLRGSKATVSTRKGTKNIPVAAPVASPAVSVPVITVPPVATIVPATSVPDTNLTVVSEAPAAPSATETPAVSEPTAVIA